MCIQTRLKNIGIELIQDPRKAQAWCRESKARCSADECSVLAAAAGMSIKFVPRLVDNGCWCLMVFRRQEWKDCPYPKPAILSFLGHAESGAP